MAEDTTSKKGPSVLEQIEASADYYGPGVYAQLLTYYSNFSKKPDFLSQDFIPVTQTKPNPKLFVVGLIPPTANISGRLLDRSGSVAAIVGAPEDVDVTQEGKPGGGAGAVTSTATGKGDPIVSVPGYQIKKGTAKGPSSSLGKPANGTPPGPNGQPPTFSNLSMPEVWNVLSNAYLQMYGREASPTEMQFYVAQCWRETGGKIPNNNFGYVGNYPTASGNGGNVFLNPYGKYFNTNPDLNSGAKSFLGHVAGRPNVRTSADAGDAMGYMTSLAQNGYFGEPIEVYYHGTAASPKNGIFPALLGQVAGSMKAYGVDLDPGTGLPPSSPNSCAFREDGFAYQKRAKPLKPDTLFRFKANSPYGTDCALGGNPAPETGGGGDWQGSGSANASQAKGLDSKTADNGLKDKQAALQGKFLAAQLAEIQQTAAAIENMKRTPPLRLLVNPISFKVSSEKIIADGNWTRNGPIIEHWGDGQDKLEGSGKLAGFFAIDANSPKADAEGESPGLTRVARNFSASYHNLLSLWLLYRNNASILTEGLDGTAWARLSMLGSIYIYYDNIIYLGSFDSFNLTESDATPYSLEYNFQFTVRATFLLDRPDEYDYGAKKFFQGIPANPVSAAATEAAWLKTQEGEGGGPVVPEPELLNPEAGGPELLNPEEGVEILNPEDVIPVKKPA